jgi:Flp pilus assembly protein TadD
VLKAMGRLDDALRSYEEVVRDHPENVVTKTGHAEVLKAMGRFDEALRAYEEVVREHPEDVVAKTGRAGILAALGKSREALRALPQGRPTTLDEWIGYHVRGMILLRTALAVARLRQRQYAAAVEVLDSVVQPRAQPQADLLRVHALGEQGLFSEASAAYLRLPPPPSSQVRELMEELRRRFVDRLPPANDNEWLIRREIDACLLAA